MSNSRVKQADKLRRHFQDLFKDGRGNAVLVHLASFCGALRSSFRSDPLEMARLEGRREVWLELQKNLNLTEQDLYNMAQVLEEDYE